MAKRGRELYTADWAKIDSLLMAQCQGTEIAESLGISPMTLYRSCKREKKVIFDVYKRQKASAGKNLLKVKQFQSANDGNTGMLIWLGKQYLGQRDKQEVLNMDNNSFLEILKRASQRKANNAG